ncbi:hypothetical protein [Azospirillum melinis]
MCPHPTTTPAAPPHPPPAGRRNTACSAARGLVEPITGNRCRPNPDPASAPAWSAVSEKTNRRYVLKHPF